MNAEFDDNVAEGVITYTTNGRRLLQGTLAVEKLDLTPYVSTIRLVAENTRDWDRNPIALDWFSGWDADLRLSAAGVRFANAQLGRTAIAATMRAGRLVVTVGESQSFSGLITGNIALAKTETGADFKTQMQFTDIDLEKVMTELFRIRRVEGIGNIAMEMESTGANVQELARNLNGSAQISAKDGALTGMNVEQLLRRLSHAPAVRQRRLPQRPHAVRPAQHRAADRPGNGDHRRRSPGRPERQAGARLAPPRYRSASSISAGHRQPDQPRPPTPAIRSNFPSSCRVPGTIR